MPPLTVVTFLCGLLSLAVGALLCWNGPAVGATARTLPRSRRAAWLFFGAGSAWFLWIVAHLGEADQILPRPVLFVAFAAVAGLSFVHAADFLAVRGLAILALLTGWQVLFASYMDYRPQNYPLKIGVFIFGVIPALFLAGYPYLLRDFLGWLFARSARARTLGTVLAVYGATLTAIAFTY